MRDCLNEKPYTLRQTTPSEFRRTEEITREAFWNVYKPGCDEHLILHQIRNSPDYLPQLDTVALADDGAIVGHIVYSKAPLHGKNGTTETLLCFGPISVVPSWQGKGVGGALIRYTAEKAKTMGYKAIGIYGNPDYYGRFGFVNAARFGITTPKGKNFDAFMMLPLYEGSLSGLEGSFHTSEAFGTSDDDLAAFDQSFPSFTQQQ